MAASRRLFFALWPPEAVAGRLHDAAKDAHAACGGRLMRRETLHITLAFLGDVAEAAVATAEAVAAAVSVEPFVLDIDRLALWRHNRILWAGCASAPPALLLLADRLGHELRAAGFRLEERPFAAHATLLREAHCPAGVPLLAAPIRWEATDYALIESHTATGGSRYEVLRRWPLVAGID